MALDSTSDITKDITWARGDTDPKIFTIKSGGTALDISSSTFRMVCNRDKNPSVAEPGLIMFDVAGVFVTDGTDGQVQFSPSPDTWADAATLPTSMFYDIEETLVGGAKRTLIKGKVKIEQDIAK